MVTLVALLVSVVAIGPAAPAHSLDPSPSVVLTPDVGSPGRLVTATVFEATLAEPTTVSFYNAEDTLAATRVMSYISDTSGSFVVPELAVGSYSVRFNTENGDPVEAAFVVEATTYNVAAVPTTIARFEPVTLSTDAPSQKIGALFVDGELAVWGFAALITEADWCSFDEYGDFTEARTLVFRVYESEDDTTAPDYGDEFVDHVEVTLSANDFSCAIFAAGLDDAKTGRTYTSTVANGDHPGVFALFEGALPAGLTLGSDGAITGTPTSPGSYTFTASYDTPTQDPQYEEYTLNVSDAGTLEFDRDTLNPAEIATLSYDNAADATICWFFDGTLQFCTDLDLATGSVPVDWAFIYENAGYGTLTARMYDTAEYTDGEPSFASPYLATAELAVVGYILPSLPDGTVGVDYEATVANGDTSGGVFAIIAGELPDGLSFSSDGTVTGTPVEAGVYTFTVEYTNGGLVETRPVTVLISSAYFSPPLPVAALGETYAATVGPDGDFAGTYTVTAGELPPGLTLATDGAITGTPTEVGEYLFTVEYAEDEFTENGNFTLRVVDFLAEDLPDGIVDVDYETTAANDVAVADDDVNGTYAVAAGPLPAGLSLADDGAITGEPTEAGTYTFTLSYTGTDAGTDEEVTQDREYTVTVSDYLAASLPDGDVGQPYEASVAREADLTGVFTVVEGSLPAGLTLAGDGTVDGTPTAAGEYTFTVGYTFAVIDAVVETAAETETEIAQRRTYTVTIGDYLAAGLPDAVIGTEYNASAAGRNSLPGTFKLINGKLPDGLSLAADGTITGTPTLLGEAAFTIEYSDESTPSALAVASVTPAAVATVSRQYTITVIAATTPAGFTLDVNSGPVGTTVNVTGPTPGVFQSGATIARFVDSTGRIASTAVVTVNETGQRGTFTVPNGLAPAPYTVEFVVGTAVVGSAEFTVTPGTAAPGGNLPVAGSSAGKMLVPGLLALLLGGMVLLAVRRKRALG
jgi:large repetitive protein